MRDTELLSREDREVFYAEKRKRGESQGKTVLPIGIAAQRGKLFTDNH
ncbi:MAG: hypothetical protein WC967_08580 [Balneolaceae bacterium]